MNPRPTYKMNYLVIFLFIVPPALFLNTAHADEVIMKDGSRVIGTVVSMKSNKLVFKTSFAGDITIQWDQVASLSTEKPVEVSLGDKRVYKGKAIHSDEGTIILKSEKDLKTAPLSMADIKTLSPPKSPPKLEFDGQVSLGVSYEE